MEKECTIIITNQSNKKEILKNLAKEHQLLNIKFFDFKELKKKLYFNYNEEALAYIMQEYHVNLNIASIYMENLYYLKDISNEKIKFLLNLKKNLEDKGYLIKDLNFKKNLKNKKIVVYGYSLFSLEEKKMIEDLEKEVIIKKALAGNYTPKVYEAKNIEEEVEFITIKISELLEQHIPIEHIKLIASSEYYGILERYSSLYHIPIAIPSNNSYFSTEYAQEFLKQYDQYTLEENITYLKEKYDDLNDFITIINKSVLVRNQDTRKEFIIRDLKNTKINAIFYDKKVDIISFLDTITDEDYVFWVGFNLNSYPKVYRNDDYLSDDVKAKLGMDTSTLKSQLEKKKIIHKLKSIKNLVVTYKLKSTKGVFYPSFILEDLNLEKEPVQWDHKISYSKLSSELHYAKDLDYLYKFNMIGDYFHLYRHNLNIAYREYNNEFTGIRHDLLKKRIGNELTLSYTNLEMYNECAFAFYINKILKINTFEESFKIMIGNITHHILELGIEKEIDISKEMIKYVKEKEYALNAREYFYLDKLSEELKLVLEIIKKQASHSKLNEYLFESELYTYHDVEDMNITFKGLIDKVIYHEINGKEVLAVIDYKTGNKAISLDTIEYGLNMQLPIYLYLLKKSDRFKDATIAGFYLQKVLSNVPNRNNKKTLRTLREEEMKLQGFSNSRTDILELLDDEYMSSGTIKGLKFNKDGNLSGKAKILSEKEMEELTDLTEEKITEGIRNILNGEFPINPKVVNQKNIACEYCTLKDICFKEKKDEVILGGEHYDMDGRTTTSNS